MRYYGCNTLVGVTMGRHTRYRKNVDFETKSVATKGLSGLLLAREAREDFRLSRLEAEVLTARSVVWLEEMVGGVLPGQILMDVPSTASMRLSRQSRCSVLMTAVDVATDGSIWREFGLESMQRCRIVRILREVHRHGGFASLGEVATLLNLTPNSVTARQLSLRKAGVWLPCVRADRPKAGQLPFEAWILDRLLLGEGSEAVRQRATLTLSGLEAVMRRAVLLWRMYQKNPDADSLAASVGLAVEEALAVVETVRRRRRRRAWKDLEASYGLGLSRPAMEGGDPVEVLVGEHGMSRVEARLFVGRLRELAKRLEQAGSKRRGEMVFFAISAQEGPRARLDEAKLVPVRLSYWTAEDEEVGPRGHHPNRVSDLKFARIQRYAGEARAQGALLTLPDLAMLLGVHVSVIRRLMAAHPKVVVPTRGRVKDIGRGVTHRRQIVELYLQMHTETEVVDRTGHSYESVEAYLREFARVMTLADQGLNAVMIRRVTGRSMALVDAYLELYRKYGQPEYLFRLAQLRQVFAREETLSEEGKKTSPPVPNGEANELAGADLRADAGADA